MKFLAIIMLVAGACLGGSIAHLVTRGTYDLEFLWFFLGSHVLAALVAFWSFIARRDDPELSMVRVMVVLGYLAGVGCGVAFVVT